MSAEITLVDKALDFYRIRKPDATEECVVNGISCSQRFENKVHELKEVGLNSVEAIRAGVSETLRVCSEINGFSRPQAAITLAEGTVSAIIGLPFGACACRPSRCTDQIRGDSKIVYQVSGSKSRAAHAAVISAQMVAQHPKNHGLC